MPDGRQQQWWGGRGGGRPQEPAVRDVSWGEPKHVKGENFEVGLGFLVVFGNQPPRSSITWRAVVNSTPRGDHKVVKSGGAVSTKLLLSGKPRVSIELGWSEPQRFKRVPIEEPELPQLTRKLEVVSTARRDDFFLVVLRRVGKDGRSEAGGITAWDWEIEDGKPKWWLQSWTVDPWKVDHDTDFVVINLSYFEKSRQITFFLPDDKEVKVIVEIPAKPKPKQEAAVEPPTKIDSEKRREAAREAGKKWMEGVITGFKPKPAESPPSRKPIRTYVVSTLMLGKRIGSSGWIIGAEASRSFFKGVASGVGEIWGRFKRAISYFRERRKAMKDATLAKPRWKWRIRH